MVSGRKPDLANQGVVDPGRHGCLPGLPPPTYHPLRTSSIPHGCGNLSTLATLSKPDMSGMIRDAACVAASLIALSIACSMAYEIRLYAIRTYGLVIHEFGAPRLACAHAPPAGPPTDTATTDAQTLGSTTVLPSTSPSTVGTSSSTGSTTSRGTRSAARSGRPSTPAYRSVLW